MAGLTQVEQVATLDVRFPVAAATDHVAYSINGTTEMAGLARTPIGATGWAAATAATPSVKANNAALTSAVVTGAGGLIGYIAVYSAVTAGTQRTDWTAVAAAKTVAAGDVVTLAIGAVAITLD